MRSVLFSLGYIATWFFAGVVIQTAAMVLR